MNTTPLKQKSLHQGSTASVTAATAVTPASQGLEEASLLSCESDVTSLKQLFLGKWTNGTQDIHVVLVHSIICRQ